MAARSREGQVLALAMAGLIDAAVWAQWVEGSSRLRRPFGFYGGLIAVGGCCLLFEDRWILLGGNCLAINRENSSTRHLLEIVLAGFWSVVEASTETSAARPRSAH